MDLTGPAIEQQTFDVVRRNGLDPDQVSGFLRLVASTIEDLRSRVAEAEARARQSEDGLHEARRAAGQATDSVLAAAEIKAALIEEAEARAGEVLTSAYSTLPELDQESIAQRVASDVSELTAAVFAGVSDAGSGDGPDEGIAAALVETARQEAAAIKAEARALLAEAERLVGDLRTEPSKHDTGLGPDIEARKTSARIVSDAESQAAAIIEAARSEAAALVATAEATSQSDASGDLAAVREEAAAVLSAARREAEAIVDAARRRAQRDFDVQASEELEAMRTQAASIVDLARSEAYDLKLRAHDESDSIIERARVEAGIIVAKAKEMARYDLEVEVSAEAEVLRSEAALLVARARIDAQKIETAARAEAASITEKAIGEATAVRTEARALAEKEIAFGVAEEVEAMKRQATELLQGAAHEAEAIIAAAHEEALVVRDEAAERAARSVADHVAAIEAQMRAAKEEAAAELEAARIEAARSAAWADDRAADIEARAQADAEQILDQARRLAAGDFAESSAEELVAEAEAMRDEAEAVLAAAALEAEGLRDQALELLEAARREADLVAATALESAAADDVADIETVAAAEAATRAMAGEVDAMRAEAEQMLNEARNVAAAIVASAVQEIAVGEPVASDTAGGDREALNEEVRRAIAAVRTVAGHRAEREKVLMVDPLAEARDGASRLLAHVRRSESLGGPRTRAKLVEDLHRLRVLVDAIERRLGLEADDQLVVDLRDDLEDVTPISEREDDSDRPSRYRLRSANLPRLGTDIDGVRDSISSIRDSLPDSGKKK